jgi:hypothetical protein
MYELVKRILDTSKENGVDIGVAYDMVANEIGYTEELKAAKKVLDEHYEVITALRVKGKEADIKIICKMAENGNETGIKNHINNLK